MNPLINKTVYEVSLKPSIVHCSSIISTSSGHLLCVWYQGPYETSKETKIMISKKSAVDYEWSNPEVLFDFNGIPLGNPVLWTFGSNLYITFSVLLEESWTSSLLFYSFSIDNGRTWTPPSLFLPRQGFMAKTPPIHNQYGDIIFPLYHEADYCPFIFIINDVNNILFSSLVAETMARRKAIQPAICGMSNNSMLMVCRTNQGYVWKSISYNGGYSWSICEPTDLPNPDSALDIISLQSGNLLLICNPSSSHRHNLALFSSCDEGQTWALSKELINGAGEYSYPCMIEDSDGNIHITYTEDRYKIQHIQIMNGDL